MICFRKHIFLFAAVVLLCGCADRSFKGIPEEFEKNTQPIAVMVAVGNPAGSTSKGSGLVEGFSSQEGREFGVYAFEKTDSPSPDGHIPCLIDNRKAKVTRDFYAAWQDEDAIYYPSGEDYKKMYDFFAYFIDDCKVLKISVEDGTVTFNMDIDGNQDIMGSAATAQQDTPKELLGSAFSYYTAQYNIYPIFYFKHYLTCLEFELEAGVKEGIREEISVESISIVSSKNVDFVVASKDHSLLQVRPSAGKLANKDNIFLKEKDGTELKKDTYKIVTRLSDSEPAAKVKIDANLLIPQTVERVMPLSITFKSRQIDGDAYSNAKDYSADIYIISNDGLLAGNKYKVTITMQGTSNVHASATLMDWTDAGSISFGEDEIKPTI